MRFAALAAAAISVAVLTLAAACGGDSDSSGEAAAEDWAGDVCSAITTWRSSLADVAQTLQQGGITQESANDAVDEARDATNTFVDDLRGLGRPDTESGQEAQQTLDNLADDLEDGRKQVDDAVEGADTLQDLLAAVPTITQALTTMTGDVSDSFSTLQGLDPGGELEDAFQQSESCDELQNS
jgi:hypothetical protein